MPALYPKEFRRDVVAVARQGDQSRIQVARSFGISESCSARWRWIADREDGCGGEETGKPSSEEPDTRALLRRVKQLEQGNEILRRAMDYFARDTLRK